MLVAVGAAVVLPRAVAAQTPPPCWVCKWPAVGSTTWLNVWVDWPSFSGPACLNGTGNPFPLSQTEFEHVLKRAIESWNAQAGTIQFKFRGYSQTAGAIQIKGACLNNAQAQVAWSLPNSTNCDDPANPVDATLLIQRDFNYQQAWSEVVPPVVPAGGVNPPPPYPQILGLLIHELGHVAGLDHPHECALPPNPSLGGGCCLNGGAVLPPDACRIPGNFKDSVMLSDNQNLTPGATSVGFPNLREHLWNWEYNALRSDPGGRFRARATCVVPSIDPATGLPYPDCCNPIDIPVTATPGYTRSTLRTVRFATSPLSAVGQVWTRSSSTETSYADPALAWGYADYTDNPGDAPAWCAGTLANCPQFLAAWAGTDGNFRIYTRAHDGVAFGALSARQAGTAQSNYGPAIAWGNPGGVSTWLVANRGKSSDRRICTQWSDDGVTWSAAQALGDGAGGFVTTHTSPAVSFSPLAGRFVLVYSAASNAVPNSDQLASAVTLVPFASTWSTPVVTVGNAAGGHPLKAQAGVDVACEDDQLNCLVSFKNDLFLADPVAGAPNNVWREWIAPSFFVGGAFFFGVPAANAIGERARSGVAWGRNPTVAKYVHTALDSVNDAYSYDTGRGSNASANPSWIDSVPHTGGADVAFDPLSNRLMVVYVKE